MAGLTVDRLRTLSRVLDELVRVPGTRFRFGVDPIIGLVPGVGDALGAVFAGAILLAGVHMGAPPAVLLRMAGNIAVDTLVGTIPIVGDIFDFGFKSNKRNLALLMRFERTPAEVHRASQLLLATLVFVFLAILAATVVGAFLLGRWLGRLVGLPF